MRAYARRVKIRSVEDIEVRAHFAEIEVLVDKQALVDGGGSPGQIIPAILELDEEGIKRVQELFVDEPTKALRRVRKVLRDALDGEDAEGKRR